MIEHLNVQSLSFHIDEVELLIEKKYLYFCGSETWLDSRIQDNFVHLANLNVYRCGHSRWG